MNDLIKKFEAAGQAQVFRFFDELSDTEKSSLCAQLESIDLAELAELNETLVFKKQNLNADFSNLKPAPYMALPANKYVDAKWLEAKKIGEGAIRAGRLAAFVVAGGQGTRLGFDAPKGVYPVSPIKGKSLFQIFAEKILAASIKYGVSIPWLIMTSNINDAATREFFEKNNFFGLKKEDVIFFKQGLMPAVDSSGKIILESKSQVVMTPDGHGGCLRAMCKSGAAAELKKRGVDCISYYQVDNPLVDIIDPFFVGFHLMSKSEMSSKMIAKAYPLEKVGHFCLSDGKLCVIEYSDLPESLQKETDASGKLKFIAGSVAIHVLDVNFVEALGCANSSKKLPFHRADKKIPYIDESGVLQNPKSANGIKFEMFVFDALPMAANPALIEGARGDEFSPVKNAEGVDSPLTCKNDQMRQFVRWFKLVGIEIPCNADGVPNYALEVSPLFASNAEDFIKAWNALKEKPDTSKEFYLG